MTKEAIYDFETLGQEFETSPVLSLGFLEFNGDKFLSENPYTYDELLGATGYIKFNVEEQVKKYGKKIQKETMDWWLQQGAEAKKVLKPSKSDKSIEVLNDTLRDYFIHFKNINKTWTRGNTFDPMFLRQILRDCGHDDPFPWWSIRDTRSYIDALLIGSDMNNRFVLPEWETKFVHHDARHDIVVDVLRMQELVRAIHYEDEIPF